MRASELALLVLLVVASPGYAESSSSSGAAQSSGPKLSFDRKGRLVQVVTPDGRRCTYQYAPDGQLIGPVDPSCGEPQNWLEAKAGG